ncbi:TPA: hypothetical protein ACJGSF_004952 [Salmonella enterica subsp. enterica serovar Muenchen]|nr:hypothetical protein [Salmonella enterica subsp. enterica serovar Poona]EHI7918952.1 hypothetical protein [Salmonella enterica]EHI9909469.1 hypothetical protein [Salmonella enterica]EHJ0911697.1 hypothetical protein [Salmonella enterica]HAF5680840.1 hypothetical protein [Salmonella enterica]
MTIFLIGVCESAFVLSDFFVIRTQAAMQDSVQPTSQKRTQAQSGGDTAAHRTAVVTSRTVKNHCDFLSYNIHILQIQSGKHQAKRRKIWWK